jgi:hypothetical protein
VQLLRFRLFALLIGLLTSNSVHAGKLDRIREEIRDQPQSSTNSDNRNENVGEVRDNSSHQPGLLSALLRVFVSAATNSNPSSQTRTPIEATAPSPPSPRSYYLKYPYAGGLPGAQRLLPQLHSALGSSTGCVFSIDDCGNPEGANENECFVDESCPKASSTQRGLSRDAISTIRTQISGEGAYDWDGLYRGTVDFSAQVAASIGFETRASLWYEPLLGPDDKLLFWDSNLLLEIPATPSVQVYLGGGARLLFDVLKIVNYRVEDRECFASTFIPNVPSFLE